MKSVVAKSLGVLLFLASCNKQGLPTKDKLEPTEPGVTWRNVGFIARPQSICINSFGALQSMVGGDFLIKSVVLENGIILESGKDVLRMQYSAVNRQDNNSIFLSNFIVGYKDGDYVVENKQAIWSLGCSMSERGTPPFTNIVYQEKIYIINTSFVWSVPPLSSKNYKILWLVL